MVNLFSNRAAGLLLISLLVMAAPLKGQTVDLNNIALHEVKRVASLLDTNKNTNSFTIRNSSFVFNNNQISWKKLQIRHLSALSVTQENSNLPMGFNDGPMHPSVGKQN